MKIVKLTSALALTMAVATVPAMAINTGSYNNNTSNTSGWNQMDRNRDGVITRDEWTRDTASFKRLDTDGNHRLTSAELKRGNHRGMDVNGDGVITFDEWRGNRTSFERLDKDHNGVLSKKEMKKANKELKKEFKKERKEGR